MSCFRVKYQLEYNNGTGLYRLPKASELIKIAIDAGCDSVFFDSGSDYDPIWFDYITIEHNYNDQVFFYRAEKIKFIWFSEPLTGECLMNILEWLDLSPYLLISNAENLGISATEDLLITGDVGFMAEEFVTEWDLPSGSFTFPAGDTGVYNAEINFSDGGGWKTVTAYNDVNLTNNFASAGTYQIRVRGTFPWFYINNDSAIDTLITKVLQWGDVGFETMQASFFGAENLWYIPEGGNFSSVNDLRATFYLCISLPEIPALDFSAMNGPLDAMCLGCSNLTIVRATFGTITNAPNSFRDCPLLTEVTNIGSADITVLTSAQNMFLGTTLSTSNYNSLLVGWEGQTEPAGITFHGGGSKYSAGAPATARAALVSNGWSITDGGLE
jgi:hypothetical protein